MARGADSRVAYRIETKSGLASPTGRRSAPGDKVATAMGGMGRAFDGGYAEYTLVPASQAQKVETGLDWAKRLRWAWSR